MNSATGAGLKKRKKEKEKKKCKYECAKRENVESKTHLRGKNINK